MAASTRHILTNVDRLAGDDELLALWNREATAKDGENERTVQQAWAAFVNAAHAAKIADRIPGSVGRAFKARYKTEAPTAVEVRGTKVAETRRIDAKASAKAVPTKRTTDKRSASTKKVGK